MTRPGLQTRWPLTPPPGGWCGPDLRRRVPAPRPRPSLGSAQRPGNAGLSGGFSSPAAPGSRYAAGGPPCAYPRAAPQGSGIPRERNRTHTLGIREAGERSPVRRSPWQCAAHSLNCFRIVPKGGFPPKPGALIPWYHLGASRASNSRAAALEFRFPICFSQNSGTRSFLWVRSWCPASSHPIYPHPTRTKIKAKPPWPLGLNW